jgi:Second Messenger Oligonucleotide or Dinucleotide Synthetase domain
MITINDAFRKFRSRLEITQKEQDDASQRQKDIRALMDKTFKLEEDFLTGSYRRYTKTKPLKDVDIFCVLHNDERHYRDKHPSILLAKVEEVLAKKYGREYVSRQRRSVTVDFNVAGQEDRVISFDVVPAFSKSDHYEIPDIATISGWTETNPRIHAEKATAANDKYSGEWKGMVRMIKKWNLMKDKPIKPSFLLEVMALDLLRPPFNGEYPYELKSFFASAWLGEIDEAWPDPAGFGPPVSDAMNAGERAGARAALLEAEALVTKAIRLSTRDNNGEALRTYRALFGDLFPLS